MEKSSKATLRVGVIGVAGYGGRELVRLLLKHSGVAVCYITSESQAGKRLCDVFPDFLGNSELVCSKFDLSDAVSHCDVLFSAQESGFAMTIASEAINRGLILIDLSADFRLTDRLAYEKWYGRAAAEQAILDLAVYGLPELMRQELRTARLIANPGCYPTSAIIGLVPAMAAGIVDTSHIVINSISGVSGAGRSKTSLAYHFPELNESMYAYAAGGVHRHTPEIEQVLSIAGQKSVQVSFTPHLAPISRGITTTTVVPLLKTTSQADVDQLYSSAYKGEPFVHVRRAGQSPVPTKFTSGTNNVLVMPVLDERTQRLTVISVLDNLIKGAAGQAIQNMNIACGLPEKSGLNLVGMWP